MPLLPGVISTGRLSALVAFAALPWFVHLVRSAVGIGTADPTRSPPTSPTASSPSAPRERIRRIAVAGIVVAIAVALAPPVLLLVAAVTVVLALTSLLVGAGWRTSAWLSVAGAAADGDRLAAQPAGVDDAGRGTTSPRSRSPARRAAASATSRR